MIKPNRLAGLVALLLVGSVTPANAVSVTYSTSGVFGSSRSNVLSQGGAVITYNALTSTSVDVAPTASTLFGSFTTTTAPTSSTATLSDTFTLTITQISPGPGSIVYTSTVGGTIFLDNSQAFVVFNGPLTRTITSGGYTTTYGIASGNEANPGLVGLFGRDGQEGTINGEIGIVSTPVPAAAGDVGVLNAPEPGTMAMACLALPLLGLGYARSRRRNA